MCRSTAGASGSDSQGMGHTEGIYSQRDARRSRDRDHTQLDYPNAHAEVALAAVEAGKSVYNEKPLTITREDGKKLLSAAKQNGVLGRMRAGYLPGGWYTDLPKDYS